MATDYGVTSGHELYSTHRFRDDMNTVERKGVIVIINKLSFSSQNTRTKRRFRCLQSEGTFLQTFSVT